jgi:hypothetical protein
VSIDQHSEPLVSPAEVAAYLGTTANALAQLRWQGIGPAYVKLSPRRIRYRMSAVESYLQAQTRTRTDQTSSPAA